MRARSKADRRRIDLIIPAELAIALDDYRASKRPILSENRALCWLIESALHEEGFIKDGT